MSSFFQRLHGATSSVVTAPPKVKQVPPQPRRKPSSETVSRTTTITKTTTQTVKTVIAKPSADHTSSVRRSGNDTLVSRVEMRRSKSSTIDKAPVTKKRKTNPVKTLKNVSEPDATRLSTLSPPVDLKRRRTASPAYRIHRTSSDDETDFSEPVKLFRGETPDIVQWPPVERSMFNPRAGQDIEFMHAKDLVCVVDKESFFAETEDEPALEVTVQLPFGEEHFKLLRPKKLDEYHPTGDVVDTVSHLLAHFLPIDTLSPDTSPQDYIYRLSKAIKSATPEHALPLLDPINNKIISLRPFTSTITQMSSLPRDLLQRICMQCYTRRVSPHLDGLRKYTAFSSTVYGELLFPFLTKLFATQHLRPGKTFVDLGCGVGNCIIQAAGETGCRAVGVEIQDHAATLASAQIAEFEARMRAWGLSHGPIEFYHGDMTTLDVIPRIMQSADVVLCNNYAFTAELNDALLRLFLELPEGARVISLKSFVPVGKDGRVRGGRGGVGEMLKVVTDSFGAGSVSWMPGGGEYYISTVRRVESNGGTPVSGDL